MKNVRKNTTIPYVLVDEEKGVNYYGPIVEKINGLLEKREEDGLVDTERDSAEMVNIFGIRYRIIGVKLGTWHIDSEGIALLVLQQFPSVNETTVEVPGTYLENFLSSLEK
jgi:hypothetical protein